MVEFTLEQLRAFVSVAEHGSFSAAGRALGRVQSAVSTAVANLEATCGQLLFDRSGRTPALTPAGAKLLSEARQVLEQAAALQRAASALSAGLEPQVRLVADSMLPLDVLVQAISGFKRRFDAVALCVSVENLGAPALAVASGRADIGISGPTQQSVDGVESRAIGSVQMVPVVASQHPLAALASSTPRGDLARATQIVLMSAPDSPPGLDVAVLSEQTYRVSDFATKKAFIAGGLGWGNLPGHLVAAELDRGELVRLSPEPWGPHDHWLTLSLVQLREKALGPAARWLVDELTHGCSPSLRGETRPG